MFVFLVGTIFGGLIGVFSMCLCVASKWGDEFSKH